VIVSGPDQVSVRGAAEASAWSLAAAIPGGWEIVGPAAAPIARLKGNWRWHFVVKAPLSAPLGARVGAALDAVPLPDGLTRIVDVDPVGML
jgi:primosomal protein N' (replication factor Y)